MIRSFIAIELNDKETIENITFFSSRLKLSQQKLKLVKPENLHLTVKFIGNIPETLAPKIYSVIKDEINNGLFQGKTLKFFLKGVGQFNKFSVLWIKLVGEIEFLQSIKDLVENLLHEKLNIPHDKRQQFKPHLTIGRLRKERINYKTIDVFRRLINENKSLEFGEFNIDRVKLKKSELTKTGPIYSDLVY
ncbi:MAG: RNA 2',3'-cyclic phosphodiesterase [Promethearchaeota archaeon]|jgi:2'-5' RNA ligase